MCKLKHRTYQFYTSKNILKKMIYNYSNYATMIEHKRIGMVNESVVNEESAEDLLAKLLTGRTGTGPYATHWKTLEDEIVSHVNQDTTTKDRFTSIFPVTYAKGGQVMVNVRWVVDPKTGNVHYAVAPATAAKPADGKSEPFVLFK
jgi:hypothetical protein